jgi:hypothetical protein
MRIDPESSWKGLIRQSIVQKGNISHNLHRAAAARGWEPGRFAAFLRIGPGRSRRAARVPQKRPAAPRRNRSQIAAPWKYPTDRLTDSHFSD